MKRRVLICTFVAAIICVCIALNIKIFDPAEFTGVWYCSDGGVAYIFKDGIIERADSESISRETAAFNGAYSFAKDKAYVFVVDDYGVGEVVELYLVRKSDGDILCERSGGNEIIWFCINRELMICNE